MKFVADIHESVALRVANNSFEEGDEVGLFALIGSTTMQEERYADNLHFVRSSGGEFVSDEPIYYPPNGIKLNLISYYPYQKEGVPIGKSTLQVSVATSQHIPEDYLHSDFLTATQKDVSASKETLALTYSHQFFRLKIALVPTEGETVETLLALNPSLSVAGFYTKAVYDFQKNAFSAYSEEKDITSAGEWEIKDGRLVGKNFILIPQETTESYQHITLKAGNKTYTSFLPPTLQVKSGKNRELEIIFTPNEDVLMSKVSGEINEWDGTEIDYSESAILHQYVDVSKLTFEKSNVYRVINSGKQVAEICKEYLVTPQFSSQAIVAYPMKKEGGVDLSQGIVAQLLGNSGNIHGGSVSWNMEDNSLTYVAGNSAICHQVYVMTDGKVSLSIAGVDNVLPVLALEDVVRDVRGGTIHNYPLVKIGTQYWMRSNLEAILYTDGNELPKINAVTENAVGYLQSDPNLFFYTANAALSDVFLPPHWNIPTWSDWNILNTYLKKDASLLKSGTWLPLKGGGIAQPATNLSGFNAEPIGIWVEPYQNIFKDKYLGYWTLDDTNTKIAEKSFYLTSDTNVIEEAVSGIEKKRLQFVVSESNLSGYLKSKCPLLEIHKKLPGSSRSTTTR